MIPPIKEYPFALRPMIAAHRGDTSLDARENSLDAIAGAMISGADMIEVDVQWTLDEIFVCSHDEAIIFGDAKHMLIHRHPYDELQQALIQSSDQSLTKLADILQLAQGKIYLNLEVKEYSDRSPRKFMDALERLLVESKMEERVLFSSFRLEYIHEASWHIPSVIIQPTNEMYFYFSARTLEPIALPKLIEDLLPSEILKISHATSYACQLTELTDARLADIRKHKILLSIYTVADDEAFDQSIALGAQALVCEDPKRFARLRNERFPSAPI
jgi:glycerophosphoryl diester phosphodiesterase